MAKSAISFDGVCPICGSRDGTIIRSKDGRYRNICRVINCVAWYWPSPKVGYENESDARNPFETDLLKGGITAEGYVGPDFYAARLKGESGESTSDG